MDAFVIMLRNVFLFVALALPGFILVKTGLLKIEGSGALSKILMYVGMPFLIFEGTINSLLLEKETFLTLGFVLLLGVVYTFLMFFASKPMTGMEKNEKTRGMMRFCSVFPNNGFLGIPLAMAVFGTNSPVLAVLIVLNIVTNVLMYTLGAYLVSNDKNCINLKKAFLNPVLIAFLVGIAVNLLNLKQFVPEVSTYSTHFKNIVTPVSMTILGMKMGAIKLSSLFQSWKTYYVSALKLILFPVGVIATLLAANKWGGSGLVNAESILGFFVAFAMPTAGLSTTFADSFSGDSDNAVAFTLGSTLISLVSIPVLYWVVCAFV